MITGISQAAAPRVYRFNKNACTVPLVGIVHHLAITEALVKHRPYTFVPSVEECEQREAMAAAWNPPRHYQGD